ncbi:unnamed protein product [Didymodactylos carnosus]|uniref:TauD/TfdA-like domain-containing protein n=1 Tax=Didymodactylos carnosus TaxID=1234261 RepID=A0A813R5N4_9BILA|nr:unnamed protein product [Didymodactylos carnosus]CAF3561947.1 unnamed protein product [Didymodactylos carnosus]
MLTSNSEYHEDLERSDTVYTQIELSPHNDGTYRHVVPGLEVFHFLEHTGKGGLIRLLDGFNVIQSLKMDHFNILSSIPARFSVMKKRI